MTKQQLSLQELGLTCSALLISGLFREYIAWEAMSYSCSMRVHSTDHTNLVLSQLRDECTMNDEQPLTHVCVHMAWQRQILRMPGWSLTSHSMLVGPWP